jgi:hypothetical protein
MAYMTKREADEFRREIKSIVDEPLRWRGYEDRRERLWKLYRRKEYTQRDREEVARIAYTRTPFEGWAGLSVSELARGAKRCSADYSDPTDEQLVREAEHATRLPRSDMGALVKFCIFAGMDIPRFDPGPNPYRSDDD